MKEKNANTPDRSGNTVKQDIESVCARLKPLLLNGIPILKIEEVLHIDYETYALALEKVIEEGGEFTQETIEAYRREREAQVREMVYIFKKKGYTNEQIAGKILYGSRSGVNDVSKRLQAENILTETDLKLGKIEMKTRRFVLKEVKAGLTEDEIASKCKVKDLDVEDVEMYILELIEMGDISREKIILARENREARNKDEGSSKQEPYEKEIEALYRLGFNGKQIIRVTSLSNGYVLKIRDKLGITAKQSKGWQSEKEEMANKRRFDISGMVSFSKKINIQTIQDQIAYLKAEKELGGVKPNDVISISRIIPMEHSLLTLGNINFVIKALSDVGKLEQAVSFINDCLEAAQTYEDTKNSGKLIDMRDLLERKIARQKEAETNSLKGKRKKWIESSVKVTSQGEVKLPTKSEGEVERQANTERVS